MLRINLRMMALAVSLATVSCSGEEAHKDRASDSKAPVSDSNAIEGLWFGSWGGGEHDGVVFQPVMAELFIKGAQLELCGFRGVSKLTGTVRFDTKAKQMQITPKAEADGQPPPKSIDYAYEIKGDKLTLTDGGKVSISLQRRPVAQNPLANAQVEFVAAAGINDAGDLLVTEFTELQAGQAGATYFQPENRSLKTKQATVFLVQETGLKKVTVNDARGLIRESTPVVVTYRPDDRTSPAQAHELWKEMGALMPDRDAVQQTYSRILKPGTLVFVLSARENVAQP
jgi:hypothetical protein